MLARSSRAGLSHLEHEQKELAESLEHRVVLDRIGRESELVQLMFSWEFILGSAIDPKQPPGVLGKMMILAMLSPRSIVSEAFVKYGLLLNLFDQLDLLLQKRSMEVSRCLGHSWKGKRLPRYILAYTERKTLREHIKRHGRCLIIGESLLLTSRVLAGMVVRAVVTNVETTVLAGSWEVTVLAGCVVTKVDAGRVLVIVEPAAVVMNVLAGCVVMYVLAGRVLTMVPDSERHKDQRSPSSRGLDVA